VKLTKYQKQAVVRAITNDIPEVDVQKRREKIQAAVVAAMSPSVRKIYRTMPHALNRQYEWLMYDGQDYDSRKLFVGDLSNEQVQEILEPFTQEERARTEAIDKLTKLVEGCSTLKQLKEALPECEKYFPQEGAKTQYPVVVANVVTDLMKLGWPKGSNNQQAVETK
jgi:hypothetical protein